MKNSELSVKKMANIPPFGLRMQAGLKRRLEAAARANNRSLNSEIVARLEQSIPMEGPAPAATPDTAYEDRLSALENTVEYVHRERLDALDERLTAVEDSLNKRAL